MRAPPRRWGGFLLRRGPARTEGARREPGPKGDRGSREDGSVVTGFAGVCPQKRSAEAYLAAGGHKGRSQVRRSTSYLSVGGAPRFRTRGLLRERAGQAKGPQSD